MEYLPRERKAMPEETSRVIHALRQLPPGDRTVLHLHYFEDMRAEEMARVLGKSAPGVRMRLTRARRRFKALLMEGGILDEEE